MRGITGGERMAKEIIIPCVLNSPLYLFTYLIFKEMILPTLACTIVDYGPLHSEDVKNTLGTFPNVFLRFYYAKCNVVVTVYPVATGTNNIF